jgi:hypothetical protein
MKGTGSFNLTRGGRSGPAHRQSPSRNNRFSSSGVRLRPTDARRIPSMRTRSGGVTPQGGRFGRLVSSLFFPKAESGANLLRGSKLLSGNRSKRR